MSSFIKRDIVEVLSGYIDLIPQGDYYKAVCPFHDDHTPSLVVYPNDEPQNSRWRCMSCSDDWDDVIGFVKKIENCSFVDALALCTDRVGVLDTFLSSLSKTTDSMKIDLLMFAMRCNNLFKRIDYDAGLQVCSHVDEALLQNNPNEADRLLRMHNV
jgi:hypothetical protein